MRLPGRIAVALGSVYLFWGMTYLAILWAVEAMPPLLMAGARHITAGVILYVWARSRGAPGPTRAQWGGASIVGMLLLLGGNGGVSWAEQHVPSGLAALIVATVPLWLVTMQAFVEGRKSVGRYAGLGIVVGLVGVALLVNPFTEDPVDPWGAFFLVLAALLWAAGSTLAPRVPRPENKLLGISMQLLTGGAALVVVGAFLREGQALDFAAITWKAGLSWVFLVVFGSLIGFTAYVWLLHHARPSLVATYAYVNPIVAVLLGVAVAGETLSWRAGLAGALILVAVMLLMKRPAKAPMAAPVEAPA